MKQHVRITQATQEGTIQTAEGVLDFASGQVALDFEMAVNAGMTYRIHLNDEKPAKTGKEDHLRAAVENAAAISDYFHCQKERFQRFYDEHADALSGFPGIWKLCGDAGIALAIAERKLKIEWGEDAEWIDTVQAFSHRVMYPQHVEGLPAHEYQGGNHDDKFLLALAVRTIEDAKAGKLDGYWDTDEANKSGDVAADHPEELDSAERADQQRQVEKFTPAVKPGPDDPCPGCSYCEGLGGDKHATGQAAARCPRCGGKATPVDVGAAVVFNARRLVLLILRRADVPSTYAGQWVLPGGKADTLESVSDAAVRELKEETGVVAYATGRLERTTLTPDGRHRRHWITCHLDPDSPQAENKEPEKHERVYWFNPTALPENMSEDDRQAILYLTGPITPGHPYAVINAEPVTAKALVITLLATVSLDATEEELAKLTPDERWEAANWAMASSLSASDNDDVVVPPKPACLDKIKECPQPWDQPTPSSSAAPPASTPDGSPSPPPSTSPDPSNS